MKNLKHSIDLDSISCVQTLLEIEEEKLSRVYEKAKFGQLSNKATNLKEGDKLIMDLVDEKLNLINVIGRKT